jgi:hypothetical protein
MRMTVRKMNPEIEVENVKAQEWENGEGILGSNAETERRQYASK